MRSKLRRSLSVATVLGLVAGSVALAAPAQAAAPTITLMSHTEDQHYWTAPGALVTLSGSIADDGDFDLWTTTLNKPGVGQIGGPIAGGSSTGDFTAGISTEGLAEGVYYLAVIAFSDNRESDVAGIYLDIETGDGPALSVNTPVAATTYSGTLPISVNASDPAHVDVVSADLVGADATTCGTTSVQNGVLTRTTGTTQSGDFTADWSVASRADGYYCLEFTAGDALGNGSWTTTGPFIIDNAAPAVPTIESEYTFSPGKLVLGEVSDVSGVTYNYQLSIDYHFFPDMTVSGSSTSNVIDLPAGLDDWAYYIQVSATDGAGHTSGWSSGLPTLHVLEAPQLQGPTENYEFDDTVPITWNADTRYFSHLDRFDIRLRYEGDPATSADDEEFIQTFDGTPFASDYETDGFTANVTFASDLPDGPWTVDVRGVLDTPLAPYPVGPWSDTLTIDRHGFAPVAPTDLSPHGDVWSVSALSWGADPIADHYEYRWAPSLATISSAAVSQTENTSATVSGLTQGDWVWQVRSVDADGDAGEWATTSVRVVGTPGFDFSFCPFAPLPLCNFFDEFLEFDILPVNSEEVDHYEVEYTELLDVTTSADDVVRTEDVDSTQVEVELPDAAGDGLYSVRVRAVLDDELEPTDSATSAWSDPVIFIRDATRAAAPELVAPATVGPFQHKVTLDWTDLNEALLWEVRVAKSPEVEDGELVDYDTYLVFDPKALPWLELLFAGELGGVPEDFSCEDLMEGFPSDDELTLAPKCGSSLELKNLTSGHYGWQARGIEFIGLFGFLLGSSGCGCTDGEWSEVGLFTIDNPKPPKSDAKPDASAGSSDGESSDDPGSTDETDETEEPAVDEPVAEEPETEQPVDQPDGSEDPEAAPASDEGGLPLPALIAIIAAIVLLLGGGAFGFFRFARR